MRSGRVFFYLGVKNDYNCEYRERALVCYCDNVKEFSLRNLCSDFIYLDKEY